MARFRYWLATEIIMFAINRLIPDEYVRSRMRMGMVFAADQINADLQIEEDHDDEPDMA